MDAVAVAQFQRSIALAGIDVADPNLRIGRELTFSPPPRRTIVVYVGGKTPPPHTARIVSTILALSSEWLLVPRYGSASDLGLLHGQLDALAICFGSNEREQLSHYLCTRPMQPELASLDLFVFSSLAKALITWDHHTDDEGLAVQFGRVEDASRLLVSLNEIGAEFEVFSNDG